tara:strand:+ start:1287 stop:3293 length:2007 start_codon:yes stop_codon:yes gene_type:complete
MFKQKKILALIIFFKLLILGLFSSEYSTSLFYTFVNEFTLGNSNPWQYYYESKLNLEAFPYHALMLYLLVPGTLLLDFLNANQIFVSNFLFKFPLFIADLSILFVFMRLFPMKEYRVLFFYFCNPIIIYAIYIHSQLDIIPMAFLFFSIYFLINGKLKSSSLFFGLAIATKAHVLVTLPLLIIYVFKRYGFKQSTLFLLISAAVLISIDSPFILSHGFSQMVLFNLKQSLLFDSYAAIGDLKLFFPVASIIFIYAHFFNQKRVSSTLLFFYIGVLFAAAIFFVYPAPAWYVWLCPFLSIYFLKNDNEVKSRLFYLVFSFIYLLFFVFFYSPEYRDILFLGKEINYKIQNQGLINVSFTLLLSMLITVMYAFYKYGIGTNSLYNKQTNLVIGIGGDSGAGKTTFLNQLQELLGNKLLTIEGDGDHKWERGDKNWLKMTHLDPKANYIHKQAQVINSLKMNNSIYRSDYDHDLGKFTEPLRIQPKEFIAISGLHPFYLPKQRKIVDLKIYFNTNEDLRRHWKIIRDIKHRNYSTDKILKQLNSRKEDSHKFIQPQREFADLIVEYFSIDKINIGNVEEEFDLGLKIVFDANLHVEEILHNINNYSWDYNEDLKTQYIVLNREPNVNFDLLINNHIPHIYEIISSEIKLGKGYEGFLQLITMMLISEKLKQ